MPSRRPRVLTVLAVLGALLVAATASAQMGGPLNDLFALGVGAGQ